MFGTLTPTFCKDSFTIDIVKLQLFLEGGYYIPTSNILERILYYIRGLFGNY